MCTGVFVCMDVLKYTYICVYKCVHMYVYVNGNQRTTSTSRVTLRYTSHLLSDRVTH